jgi:hypothetical protein
VAFVDIDGAVDFAAEYRIAGNDPLLRVVDAPAGEPAQPALAVAT